MMMGIARFFQDVIIQDLGHTQAFLWTDFKLDPDRGYKSKNLILIFIITTDQILSYEKIQRQRYLGCVFET